MNPALTADEAGYQQSDSGAAVVVVGDASAQVLAGSGARPLHVDDLAVMGEEPVAFAALNEGSTTDKRELLAFAKERQARYKLPTEVRLIEALPRNAMGKVAKPELRERVKQ